MDQQNTSDHLNDSMFGGEYFQKFYEYYKRAHLPLSSIICLIGVITNALNICVLTRPNMISPMNILMASLSASQLCLVSNYFVLLIFNLCYESCWSSLHKYPSVSYKWLNVNLNVVFHSVAFTHTLILALIRFLALKAPNFSRNRINIRSIKGLILITYLSLPILCMPMFFMSYVDVTIDNKCQWVDSYDLVYTDDETLAQISMWLFGVLFKLVPSIGIVVLSFYLISSLKNYDRQKARLVKGHASLVALASNAREKACNRKKRARKKQTKMLVIVALFCASVELPHGMVNLLMAIFGQPFAKEVYDNLGDFFEMLTLLYSSVNFILYCLMNKEYQKTFYRLFCERIRVRTVTAKVTVTKM